MSKPRGINAKHSKDKNTRIAQANFLIENLVEPVLIMNDATISSLNDTFNLNDDQAGFNPAMVTMAIINLNYRFDKDTHYEAVESFMRNIQDYLPYKLRVDHNIWGYSAGSMYNKTNTSEETKEILNKLHDWLFNMRFKVENEVTYRYMLGNKQQLLETLKRRFREKWGDKIETTNENHTTLDGGISLNIKFKELNKDD